MSWALWKRDMPVCSLSAGEIYAVNLAARPGASPGDRYLPRPPVLKLISATNN